MASLFISNIKTSFLPSLPSSCSSSSSSSTSLLKSHHAIVCKALNSESTLIPLVITKRNLAISLSATFLLSLASSKGSFDHANAAILEADEDDELMERIKKDRKKRIERQGAIISSNKETAYLQDGIYQLSKVGQAIENNDLSSAFSVLGQNTDTDWVKKVNAAFNKLSYSPEEKSEADTFNSSISSLISSVSKNDVEASKLAFVASASSLEKWTTLTGLVGQLKGL
ncbi:hypothetical protein LIER_13796 [Lithospermum erythrorhizon]|uniref:Maintenance of Photosystem II under High light 2 C-terminal domain-containing protein n=1 Tax=Lithospermum erythrorhizon TaxID=34254 RepID=A0AAV3PYQ8_LITER